MLRLALEQQAATHPGWLNLLGGLRGQVPRDRRPAPLAYLTWWRMRLAERAMREEDTTIAALAAQLGYASESSFSHAFQRITGTTPGRCRRTADAPRVGQHVAPL